MTGLPLTGEEGEAAAPRQGRRPKVESPKVHIGFRLDADLVKAIKATGKGYNVRVEKVLCGALARGELNADRDLFDARLGGPERMTWNYRVIRHKEGHLALHEVYYNEAGQPRAYSQQPVTFIGDGDDALQELIGALEIPA